MSDVPLEMVETIIDHCHDNIQLLGTCALVCKAWLRPSRFLLFSNSRASGVTRRNLSDLLSLIESPHSTFPLYFHSVWFKEELNPSELDAFVGVVAKLLQVYHLTLLRKGSRMDPIVIMQAFPSITTLSFRLSDSDLHDIQVASDTGAFHFISSFPQLEFLTLTGSLPGPDDKKSEFVARFSDTPLPPRLNVLKVNMIKGAHHIFQFIKSHTTLSRLIVLNITADDFPALQAYIGSSCSALRHLSYEVSVFLRMPFIYSLVVC